MRICPTCGSSLLAEVVDKCNSCGAPLKEEKPQENNDTVTEDADIELEDDFQDQTATPISSAANGDPDGLEVETTSDIVEHEAHTGPGIPGVLSGLNGNPSTPGSNDPNSAHRTGEIKKLSQDELDNIEKKFYGKHSSIRDHKEQSSLVRKFSTEAASEKGEQPFANAPIVPPKKDGETEPSMTPEELDALPKPPMAKHGKSKAYFFKNYIQLVGRHQFYDGEEMYLGDRVYELKPKKIERRTGMTAAISLFVVLLIAIGWSFRDSSEHPGQIMGVVLDDFGQPYIHGATIRFPEIDRDVKTNPLGFFKSGGLNEGSYKVEYVVDGKIIKTDYATVVDDETTLISIKPSEGEEPIAEAQQPIEAVPARAEVIEEPASPPPAEPEPSRQTVQKSQPAKKSEPKTVAATPRYGKITLAANVTNAKFELDGNVLGAGNITYSKISNGRHRYVISKEGYEPFQGFVQISNGESKKLAVTLMPMAQEEKVVTYDESDFYYSGVEQQKQGAYNAAITDFDEAINIKPSYADAYFHRAECYEALGQRETAIENFVRSAEIYQFQNQRSWSVTAYSRALDIDDENITALLGRANAFLNKKELQAAVVDFERVVKLDKRNPKAYYGLGEARFRQGNYKRATDHFKDAKSLEPTNPLIYQYLMLCYMARSDFDEVKETYEKFTEVASAEEQLRFDRDRQYAAIREVINH